MGAVVIGPVDHEAFATIDPWLDRAAGDDLALRRVYVQRLREVLDEDPDLLDQGWNAVLQRHPHGFQRPSTLKGADLMRKWQAIEGWEVSYSDMRYGGHDKVFVRSHPELRELTDRLDATGET